MRDSAPSPLPVDDTPEQMARASGCALRVEGLTFRTKGKTLMRGVDLALGTAGITTFIGYNGAGKSLLLRLLHGLLTPSSGTILWHCAQTQAAYRPKQAMVFQKPVLLRRSTLANIEFVLPKRDRTRRQTAHGLLRQVGLSDKAEQPARLLSGGEQQRLALARALATRPEVLLLDEATANLDPASALMIETLVRKQAENGTRIILVTHDLAQARRLADDIVFVHAGQISEHQPAATFFENPISDPARAFLGGQLVV